MTAALRVLLADDEPLALERLVLAFHDLPGTVVVGTAVNGIDAAEKIAALKPDLAVLDIQMPGRSGLGVAAAREAGTGPEVIFLTAYDHYAVDAFDIEAADYLLKPLRFDRLRQAVERARRRRAAHAAVAEPAEQAPPSQGDDDVFWVQGRHGLVRVGLDEVEWIEAAKDYVLIHTATRGHIQRATMAAIEARFPPPALMRVHRSAFVRPGAVRSFQQSAAGGATLVLSDGVAVPVGPSYLPQVALRFGSGV